MKYRYAALADTVLTALGILPASFLSDEPETKELEVSMVTNNGISVQKDGNLGPRGSLRPKVEEAPEDQRIAQYSDEESKLGKRETSFQDTSPGGRGGAVRGDEAIAVEHEAKQPKMPKEEQIFAADSAGIVQGIKQSLSEISEWYAT